MLTTFNYSPFPCTGCSHSGVCKYEESVMSFCRSNNAASTIDCLTLEYKCKHREARYATALRADSTVITNCGTGRTYTTGSSSKCIN